MSDGGGAGGEHRGTRFLIITSSRALAIREALIFVWNKYDAIYGCISTHSVPSDVQLILCYVGSFVPMEENNKLNKPAGPMAPGSGWAAASVLVLSGLSLILEIVSPAASQAGWRACLVTPELAETTAWCLPAPPAWEARQPCSGPKAMPSHLKGPPSQAQVSQLCRGGEHQNCRHAPCLLAHGALRQWPSHHTCFTTRVLPWP